MAEESREVNQMVARTVLKTEALQPKLELTELTMYHHETNDRDVEANS